MPPNEPLHADWNPTVYSSQTSVGPKKRGYASRIVTWVISPWAEEKGPWWTGLFRWEGDERGGQRGGGTKRQPTGYRTGGAVAQTGRAGGGTTFTCRTKRTTAARQSAAMGAQKSEEECSDGEDRTAIHRRMTRRSTHRWRYPSLPLLKLFTKISLRTPCAASFPTSPTEPRRNPCQIYVVEPLHAVKKVVRSLLGQVCKATNPPSTPKRWTLPSFERRWRNGKSSSSRRIGPVCGPRASHTDQSCPWWLKLAN